MKVYGQIKGSLRGAPLFTRRFSWPSTAHERGPKTTYAQLCQLRKRPRLSNGKRRATWQQGPPQGPVARIWVPPPVLVKALHHAPSGHDEPSKLRSIWMTKTRAFSSAVKEQEKEDTDSVPPQPHIQEDMLSMVDGVQDASVDEQFRAANDPYLRRFAEADGPELTVSERTDDKNFPSFRHIQSHDQDTLRTVRELWRTVRNSLKRPLHADIEYIWSLYQSLPQPRMLQLPSTLRHRFMKVIGQDQRNNKSMLRYFTAVADIRNSGLRLIPPEWNQAMSFAGRYVGHTTHTELEVVMKLWHEMEGDMKDAGFESNAVTFNVLFDVASKAGNYVLSEMLYNEMEKRGHKFNRYHHVSLIHFFGLKMDSDGIRAAYKEMVEAGEMIDSTVLNCVIAGFLRCGEEYAAERVYERMRSAHMRAPKMPYRNYMSAKVVSKVLDMFSKVSRQADDSDLHSHFQQLSPVVPDIRTYDILITHYTLRTPAMDKVAKYLDDMKWFQIPMHGSIFLTLFKGFAKNGGSSQAWGSTRLEKIYVALLSARQDNVHGLYISVWMAKWILRAFSKCYGEDRVWEIWDELKPFCDKDFGPDGDEYFQEFLAELLSKPRGSWRFRDTNLFGTLY